MKKLTPFLLLLIMIGSGCGLFKKVSRTIDRQESTTKIEHSKDSVGTTIDKSVTTIKEKIDTVITTKEKEVVTEQIVNIDSFVNAVTDIKNDLFNVRLEFNKITGVLKSTTILKPQSIPIKFERVTTKQNDIVSNSQTNSKAIIDNKTKNKHIEKTKEPAKMGVWLIAVIVGLLIVVGSIWYWFRKRLP